MQDPTPKMVNEAVINKLSSDDMGIRKEAADAISEYTRIKMREDGFLRRILPPVTVSDGDLDRQVDTDKPVVVVDKEPDSPAAITIPFATLPSNRYILGPRYRVMFARMTTPKFTKDVVELKTYDMDIRQILSDNSIKDLLAEEDGKFLAAVDALIGAESSTVTETGVVQNRVIAAASGEDAINRASLAESMKTLPRTPNHLNPAVCLVNNITIWDIVKFGRDEVGGDLAEEMLLNGFSERVFLNCKWIITIKTDLVGNNIVYQFAEPKFMGKFFTLEDTTMYVDRKAYMLEFFAYECIGAAIGNVAAVAKIRFAEYGASSSS